MDSRPSRRSLRVRGESPAARTDIDKENDMRIARKFVLFTAMALAALAMSAGTASAEVEVFQEDGDVCSQVVLSGGHTVSGGCLAQAETENHIPLVVQTAGGPVTLTNCNVHFDGRISGTGSGYATVIAFTNENPPTTPGCTRKACDEGDNGADIPWPFQVTEPSAGTEMLEVTLCLEPSPDGSHTSCELHVPMTTPVSHEDEAGDNATYTCENLPQISFQNFHFVGETGAEGAGEVIH